MPGTPDPVVIPRTEALYLLLGSATRPTTAITYHRKLRDRSMTRSVLDGIPGGGDRAPAGAPLRLGRRRAAQASLEEELEEVPGVGPQLAKVVYDHICTVGVRGGSRSAAVAPADRYAGERG